MSEIQFQVLSAGELAADAGWWQIYDEAFAANAREPRSVILEAVRRGVGMVVAAREGGRTTGLASLHLLREPAVQFLVYLAVDAPLRGSGIGGELLTAALEQGKGRLEGSGLVPQGWVCEVALPSDDHAAHEEERVLRFYARYGGRVLPHAYVQPPVDGVSLVPMRLVYAPEPGVPLPDAEQTAALVQAIYREKYGAINGISRLDLEECLRLASAPPPTGTRPEQ